MEGNSDTLTPDAFRALSGRLKFTVRRHKFKSPRRARRRAGRFRAKREQLTRFNGLLPESQGLDSLTCAIFALQRTLGWADYFQGDLLGLRYSTVQIRQFSRSTVPGGSKLVNSRLSSLLLSSLELSDTQVYEP